MRSFYTQCSRPKHTASTYSPNKATSWVPLRRFALFLGLLSRLRHITQRTVSINAPRNVTCEPDNKQAKKCYIFFLVSQGEAISALQQRNPHARKKKRKQLTGHEKGTRGISLCSISDSSPAAPRNIYTRSKTRTQPENAIKNSERYK